MPTVKELNIQVENRPGTLAKAVAGRKVNIIAFQALLMNAGTRYIWSWII